MSSAKSITCDKFEVLLEVSRAIAQHRDFSVLLAAVSELLHDLIEFEFLEILLFDAANHSVRVLRPQGVLAEIGKPEEFLIEDGPGGWVWQNQQPIIMGIEELRARYPKVAALRELQGIRGCCTVPMTTSLRRLGVIDFNSQQPNAYRGVDIGYIEQIVSQVAVSIDNALHFESAIANQEKLQVLLDTTSAAVSARSLQDLVKQILEPVQHFSGAAACSLLLRSEPGGKRGPGDSTCLAAVFPGEGIPPKLANQSWPIEKLCFRTVFETGRPVVSHLPEAGGEQTASLECLGESIRTVCSLPLTARGWIFGVLNFGHDVKRAFSEDEVELLMEIAGRVSISADNIYAYQKISQLRDRLTREKNYLEEEIRLQHNFEEIIGESAALKDVLEQVKLVAALDSSVLICGETGTGKELIARAIHSLSRRSSYPLIKVNCAAIPTGLLESDLFGHEKGSFTGATAQKIGRFELAHHGTLFLDEIGDISFELQPKLLRALQEHEIERVGGTRSIKVDARIIAATNQNLEQMIAERQFRRDLYYRLNVFPLYIPPLRERPNDIPPLVRHFVQKFSRKMRREIDTISAETMSTLCHAQWPGNVRELENYIERAVILTRGRELTLSSPVGPVQEVPPVLPPSEIPKPNFRESTRAGVEAAEREEILRALRATNGIVAGPRGAANLLGIKRTTLHSLMRRLGISKKDLSS